MGFLSKFKKNEPSMAEYPAAVSTAAPNDPEKAEAMAIENGNQSPVPASPPHIDPELEKKVLRKLDKRLVSLAFVLCMSQTPSLELPTDSPRSPGIPRPIKHWVRISIPIPQPSLTPHLTVTPKSPA